MPGLGCLDDEELRSAVAGEETSVDLLSHVAHCASCRERLQQLQAEFERLRQAIQVGSPPPSPAEQASPERQTERSQSRDIPQAIGKYKVVSELAHSGQAVVYRAIHPALATDVVLKLGHEPAAGDQHRHRLVSEGRILARLEHPNLARVFDLDFEDNRPFLVLEYVRGWNLREQRRRHGQPKPRQLALLMAQVARGLGAAHAAGVLHLDIKSENIVVDEQGRPRILDFGLALWSGAWGDDAERRSGICGTPGYMAPEQARGDKHRLGPRTDVFALGAVLYQQLTGEPPFSSTSRGESLQRAQRCDFDREALHREVIPPGLAAICLRAMSEDPADRYAKAEDMAAAFERFARRGRTATILSGATVLLLVMMAGIALLFRPTDSVPASPPLQYLVRVHRGAEPEWLDKAIPLKRNDLGRIICEFPADVQVALFWRDQKGLLTELDPKNIEVSPAGPSQRLVYPSHGTFQLDDAVGTEFVFVCGSRGQRPQGRDVEAALGNTLDQGKNPKLPRNAMIVMNRDRLAVVSHPDEETPRGHRVVSADRISLAEDRFEHIRQVFRQQYDFFVGVAFPHE